MAKISSDEPWFLCCTLLPLLFTTGSNQFRWMEKRKTCMIKGISSVILPPEAEKEKRRKRLLRGVCDDG